jgi:transposase
MDQKTQFIADYLRQTLDITELCQLYGVSRKTGYKWIERYVEKGPQGLEDRSRRPGSSPNQTPEEIIDALIQVRQRHPSWAPRSLCRLSRSGIRIGHCQGVRPCAIFSSDAGSCPRSGAVA